MNTTIKLHSLSYTNYRMYFFATLFVAGNILLPQLAHMVPQGGLMLLPIYFFTLIAAYKYGIFAGLLTAILSPLANYALFGMPVLAMLPIILTKSVLLAVAASFAAKYFKQLSILALVLVVLAYQLVGTMIEWAMVKDFWVAVSDFRLGLPGMLLQIFGGYLVLKALAKY